MLVGKSEIIKWVVLCGLKSFSSCILWYISLFEKSRHVMRRKQRKYVRMIISNIATSRICIETVLIEIFLLSCQLKSDEIVLKNRAKHALSNGRKRKFSRPLFNGIMYLPHYFWIALSILISHTS